MEACFKRLTLPAVLALMEFRSEKKVESLHQDLADKDLEVLIFAKEALKRIGRE